MGNKKNENKQNKRIEICKINKMKHGRQTQQEGTNEKGNINITKKKSNGK